MQRTVGSILHNQVGKLLFDAYIQYRDDMGMAQHRQQLRFLQKRAAFLRGGQVGRMHNFDSNRVIVTRRIFAPIDTPE